MAVLLGDNQYWPGGFMALRFFYVPEHPKVQPAVVLVSKRLRRRLLHTKYQDFRHCGFIQDEF